MASLALAFDILARDRASKTFDKVGRSAETAGHKGSGFGTAMKRAAGIAAGAIAAAGIADMFRDIVTAGSELQQNVGGAQAVFKDSFGAIDKSAKDAANSLGLSRSEYLQLSTVLGAGLKNKGVKDYAAATQDLVGVGADLAAQYGGSTKDAVDALSSALRGEMDPIERYGVALNQSAVQAEAMRLGLVKASVDTGKVSAAQLRAEVAQKRYNQAVKEHGKGSSQAKTAQAGLISAQSALKKALGGTKAELDDTTKAQAALSLITRQTKDAQGAFGREADTYAGQQARLAANVQNLKERLGTALLPVLTRVSGWFLNKGLPAVERFGGWISDKLWPALKQGYETIMPGVREALDIITDGLGEGGAGGAFRKYGDIIVTKVIPVAAQLIRVWLPQVARNIRIVIEAVKLAWKIFETGRAIVGGVITFLLRRFADLSDMWGNVLEALGKVPGFGWAKDAAAKLKGAADKADALADAIERVPDQKNIKINFSAGGVSKSAGGGTVTGGRVFVPGLGYVNAAARAGGGPVNPGQVYQVGDNPDGSWNSTTEILAPRKPMRVLNQEQMAKQLGVNSGGTGMVRLHPHDIAAIVDGIVRRPTVVGAGSIDSAMARGL